MSNTSAASPPSRGQVARVLVVKPSSLGDVLHTFPAVGRLGAAFPDAVFDWLIHPSCAAVLDYAPVALERKILFRRRELGSWRLPLELRALVGELRRARYDLVIDFQGLLRSAAIGFCAPHRRMAGFARPREASAGWFYNQRYPVEMKRHAVERNWDLAGMAAGEAAAPVRRFPLPISMPNRTAALQRLLDAGYCPTRRLAAVAPGARWASKCFPPEWFAAVMQAMNQGPNAWQFVLVGAAAERAAGARIAALTPALDLTGQTSLGELMEILRLSDTLLCNDSGPMHMMAALGGTVSAAFGPTLAELTGPFGAGHGIYRRDDLSCLGCLKRQCPKPYPACHELDPVAVGQAIARDLEPKLKLQQGVEPCANCK